MLLAKDYEIIMRLACQQIDQFQNVEFVYNGYLDVRWGSWLSEIMLLFFACYNFDLDLIQFRKFLRADLWMS